VSSRSPKWEHGRGIMRELLLTRRNALIMRTSGTTRDADHLAATTKDRHHGGLKEALGTSADATVFRKLACWSTAPATRTGVGTTPWTSSPVSTSWAVVVPPSVVSAASGRSCRPWRPWSWPPRPATTRRRWRRCSTSRPTRPCSSWCAPAAWRASRWLPLCLPCNPGGGATRPAGRPLGLRRRGQPPLPRPGLAGAA